MNSPEIRELAKEIVRLLPRTQLRLMQGQVSSIQADSVTLTVRGGSEPVPGWRYLLDGYSPVVGDVVWVLDGGPGTKLVLGTTRR